MYWLHCTSDKIHLLSLICRYYEFVDNYNFDREVVGIALNYLDRYISKRSIGLAREMYQLIATSSLSIAIKVHSVCDDGTASRTKALRRLCCGHFADKAILATMEQDILETLEWFVNPPTLHGIALAFSQVHPLRLVSAQDNLYVYEAARFQCELAVFLPNLLLKYRPSEIAFAAMQNAMEKVDPIVLTDKIKTQFNSLLHHPETKMDPSKVEEVKAYMKRALPEMEDDAGEEPQRRSIGDSPSPTNVAALVMVTECDEEC